MQQPDIRPGRHRRPSFRWSRITVAVAGSVFALAVVLVLVAVPTYWIFSAGW